MNCPQFNCHILYLILFLLVGEVAILHVRNVTADGIGHHRVQVSITTQETRTESVVHAKHVLNHQYLTVYVVPAPIPIIGMVSSDATRSARVAGIFSSTMAKQPASSNRWASRISFSASASSLARTV